MKNSSFSAFALVAFFISALCAPNALSATYTVNTANDSADAAPGNGICRDISGRCSFRAALTEANLGSNDTIVLPAGSYRQMLVAANEDSNAGGDWDIRKSMTITGAGTGNTSLRAANSTGTATERVLDIVLTNIVVNISNLKIENGRKTGTPSATTRGGGIKNSGTLVLNNTIVQANQSPQGGGIANDGNLAVSNTMFVFNACITTGSFFCSGGALHSNSPSNGTLLIAGVSFVLNQATGDGLGGALSIRGISNYTANISNASITTNASAGALGQGAGVYVTTGNGTADVTISDTTMSSNEFLGGAADGRLGGGIAFESFTNGTIDATLSEVSIDDNAASDGGGISVNAVGAPVTVAVFNSSITNNRAKRGGGAAIRASSSSASQVKFAMTNSTVSGNETADPTGPNGFGSGGGFDIFTGSSSGPQPLVSLNFCTITANHTDGTGGGVFALQGVVNIKNSILAENTADVVSDDMFGNLVSANFNHFGSGISPLIFAADDVAGNPLLGPLQNGATKFHLPLTGSPLINMVPFGTNNCGNIINIDQRFLTRPSGGNCDKGAVELQ